MEKRIFLDNIVFNIQKFGGASTYWLELLKVFSTREQVFLINQKKETSIDLKEKGVAIDNKRIIIENILPAKLLRYLPFTKRLPSKSIYHNSYYRTCLQKNVVNIFTIHDFTHKRGLASKFPRNLVHIGLTYLGLKTADGIICISESTKKDLNFYYPEIPESKIRVIYHGIVDDFHPLKVRDGVTNPKFEHFINKKFILFIGKRDGYKRFDVVIDALKEIDNLELVIVGGGELNDFEKCELEKVAPGRFYKIDGIDNKSLNILYNRAYAFVYPSIYEGFGFPVGEAMKAGCPVITTRLTSIPEVAGDAAIYLDSVSGTDLARKLSSLDNVDFKVQTVELGIKQAAKFTWQKCAEETFSFYSHIYQIKYPENNDF